MIGGEDPGFPTSTFYSTTYQGAWNGSTLVWTQIHAGGNPKPAARVDGINWIDTSGNLWLWGGRKINGNPDELNEVRWTNEFDPSGFLLTHLHIDCRSALGV